LSALILSYRSLVLICILLYLRCILRYKFVFEIQARRNYATYNYTKLHNQIFSYKEMSSNIQVTRICQFCRGEFTARTTVTKYCSHRCASMAYKARHRGTKVETSNAETVQTLSAPVIELQTKDFLTVAEVCRLLNVSRWTLARAIKDERLKAVRLGKRIVIKRSDVDRLFN